MRAALVALCMACATPVVAQAPLMSLPVDCTLGESCHIQQFMDRDPGPGAADFACGTLSYDGHNGTDFALPSLAARADGVAVLAAADGVVAGVRDGMPDIVQGAPGAPDVAGRECGNGVVIRHADGYETQYCHLARGSVAVQAGDSVTTGTILGLVGLSGQTEFPHLHLSVRHNGEEIDPFDPAMTAACNGAPQDTLWRDAPAYTGGGIVGLGFATAVPDFAAVKAGTAAEAPAPTAPALVLWGHFYGGRTGDSVQITIDGPQGRILDHRETLERTQAQLYRAAGRRIPAGGWPAGVYTGKVQLLRNDAILANRQISFEMSPS
ncbi:MAG: M23 family metallopeptidase [Rhodobacterales bacterium]|nr:M23 family metallopeptidase [Rhodobacterales bacterium]